MTYEENSTEVDATAPLAMVPGRAQIAIGISDPTNRRLIEGIAAQLELEPFFLEEAELSLPDRFLRTALLVVDEPIARRYRPVSRPGQPEALQPALVAVVPIGSPDSPLIPRRDGEQPFDGLLALPQTPSIVVAQLSVILYAHRAYVRRYASAMEELQLNRRIFRSVTSGISVANATEPDFPLVYVNPAFEVMTGYSLEDIVGQNCRFLQREERDQPGLTLIREALRGHRETVVIIRNYRKDGSPFWNELSLSPIFDREGRLTHFVGIQNDVSGRVAFEEALRESEKLAAVGRLAASIAHEINNPLEAVTNLLYLARRERSEPEREQYFELAERELHRVSLLTTQSLRFYRQSSAPQAIRPTDLIAAVLDVYAVKLANLGITVERRGSSCESIVCLESEIRQVVSNLVRNAMDAMKAQGGRLLVRVREATDWPTGTKGVLITVADTGTGMTPETRQKLYTAFFTTKGISGTGLGLWVSSEIVNRHRGHLRVRSRQQPGRTGTVFALFLPYQGVSP